MCLLYANCQLSTVVSLLSGSENDYSRKKRPPHRLVHMCCHMSLRMGRTRWLNVVMQLQLKTLLLAGLKCKMYGHFFLLEFQKFLYVWGILEFPDKVKFMDCAQGQRLGREVKETACMSRMLRQICLLLQSV